VYFVIFGKRWEGGCGVGGGLSDERSALHEADVGDTYNACTWRAIYVQTGVPSSNCAMRP
jgi:hypothetical protein